MNKKKKKISEGWQFKWYVLLTIMNGMCANKWRTGSRISREEGGGYLQCVAALKNKKEIMNGKNLRIAAE